VQIVEDLGKGIESCDISVEGEWRFLMKLIVMTETASESGALLEAIEDGEAVSIS
jgi:hypothetical protein